MAEKRLRGASTAHTAQCWVSASAVTVGLGAAMLAGAATAQADTVGTDSTGERSATARIAADSGGDSPQARPTARQKTPPSPARSRNVRTAASPGTPAPAAGVRTAATLATIDPVDTADTAAAAPRAGTLFPGTRGQARAAEPTPDDAISLAVQQPADRTQHLTPPAEAAGPAPSGAASHQGQTPTPASTSVAALPEAQADPSWNMESYLGGVKVVPGSSVRLAQQEIAAAQDVLRAGTWGAGKPAAGLASLVPQLFLAQAAGALSAWQDSIEKAKSAFADTIGVPVIHELAGLSLVATMMVPSLATVALELAALTTPVVGVLGSAEAASQAGQLIAQAQLNGLVYAVVPYVMGRGVNAITPVSVNNGPWSPVVLDTGSSGLSITNQYVGQSGLGAPTGTGEGAYGEGPTIVRYEYDSYTTRFGFRNRTTTGPTTVNIVQDLYAQAFNNYQYPDGIVGVLGLGANRPSGPNNIVALPGELKDGVLLLQFGLWGLAVFGPNPLPVRASVAGAPDAYTQIQINDGPKQAVKGIIDSGGVYGYVPAAVVGTGPASGQLPSGTRVSVFTGDGQTLLYSYTTTDKQPLGISEGDEFNSGNIPFQLGPIYIDYSQPDGIGTTVFCAI